MNMTITTDTRLNTNLMSKLFVRRVITEGINERNNKNTLDRDYLEPNPRLLEGEPGLRALLRGTDGRAIRR